MSCFQTNPHADLMLQTCHFICSGQQFLISSKSSCFFYRFVILGRLQNVHLKQASNWSNCHQNVQFFKGSQAILNIGNEAVYCCVKQHFPNIAPERTIWRRCNIGRFPCLSHMEQCPIAPASSNLKTFSTILTGFFLVSVLNGCIRGLSD